MKKVMMTLGTLVLTVGMGVVATSPQAEAATEYPGGGIWEHGTAVYISPASSWTYSNYYHKSYSHSATARNGNGKQSKAVQSKGVWAKASVVNAGVGQAFYNYW